MNIFSAVNGLFGRLRTGGNAYSDTIVGDIDRANVRFFLPEDSRLYTTEWTRRKLNEKSEWLYQNFPCVKEMGEGIGRHTIGKGISIQCESEDAEWNKQAEHDFEDYALTPGRCDIAGRRNLYEAQMTAIEQFIFRGEFMAGFVENPRWKSPVKDQPAAPAFWVVDTNDVQTPPVTTDDQTRHPGGIIDGVGLGRMGESETFYVRTAGEMDFAPIDAASFCHFFKPHAVNQVRGITPLASAVNSLVDIHELRRLTTRTAKAQQMVAMVIKGMGKQPGKGAFGSIAAQAPSGTGVVGDTREVESMGQRAGATVAYMPDNGDVKIISSSSPSPLVEPFVRDLLMRDASLAAGVPMEFFWDPSKLGGANVRFVLGRADLFFQVLADSLIYRFCTPLAVRVLAWRMEAGLLPRCKDPRWMSKITWQLPARLTVDNGREGALDIQKLQCGMLNLRAFYNARGMNWHTELTQRIREMKELKRMCDEAGMPELFQYFTALDPGAQLIQAEQKKREEKDATREDDDEDDKKAAA